MCIRVRYIDCNLTSDPSSCFSRTYGTTFFCGDKVEIDPNGWLCMFKENSYKQFSILQYFDGEAHKWWFTLNKAT